MNPDVLQLQPPWLDAQHPRQGRYVLGPLLGKGGMGEVVEAWDVVLCRTVALKILRNMEPTALIRFMHEAQIQARVVHPRICRIYDVESSEGTVKIAMQLVRGPNLEQACRDLSLETVVTLLAQVAEAVHAAHNLKLIHRDLKPSNILLERDADGRWAPFICDFGLAMSMDEPALTYSNGIIGTPAYMAPEQYHGERNRIGPATDVYGLGGTLHFALLGRAPLGPTPADHKDQPGFTPGDRQALPRDLWIIMRKCLEADPGSRYPSAAALAEDLWRFLSGEPVLATTPSPLTRFWRRWQGKLKVTLFTALAAGVFAGAYLLAQHRLAVVQARSTAITHLYAQEAAAVEREILLERTLPLHDLRPAYARARLRMDQIRTRMEALDAGARAPAHWALACLHELLGERSAALEEARKAWDGGFMAAEVANFQATAQVMAWMEPEAEDGAGPRDPFAALPQVEALFQAGKGLNAVPDDHAKALLAFLRKDYGVAVDLARASAQARRWDAGSVCLQAYSHCALALQQLDAGDPVSAKQEYEQAMKAAQDFLALSPSDESAHHVYLLSARSLASSLADAGNLTEARLEELSRRTEQAFLLDPGNPALQEDWLGLRFLRISQQSDQGLDADRDLDASLVFVGTRLKEPLTPQLRRARMLIFWRMAERALDRGEDPASSLTEALKDLGPAPFLRPDYQGQVLLCKARWEVSKGQDPRPTVAEALKRIQASPGSQASGNKLETAAEGWLINAQWEADHGLEAWASLRQAETLSESALQTHARSASAQALNGLCKVLALKLTPGNPMLRLVAQERLRAALALKPTGRLQARLRKALKT